MYGLFTYIYHKFKPNIGKYTKQPKQKGKTSGSSASPKLVESLGVRRPALWGGLAAAALHDAPW